MSLNPGYQTLSLGAGQGGGEGLLASNRPAESERPREGHGLARPHTARPASASPAPFPKDPGPESWKVIPVARTRSSRMAQLVREQGGGEAAHGRRAHSATWGPSLLPCLGVLAPQTPQLVPLPSPRRTSLAHQHSHPWAQGGHRGHLQPSVLLICKMGQPMRGMDRGGGCTGTPPRGPPGLRAKRAASSLCVPRPQQIPTEAATTATPWHRGLGAGGGALCTPSRPSLQAGDFIPRSRVPTPGCVCGAREGGCGRFRWPFPLTRGPP